MESHLTRFEAQTRRKELMHTFHLMADYAQSNDVCAILISGDIFDTPCVSPSAVSLFLDTIRIHNTIDFLCLPGNHDRDLYSILTADTELPDNFYIVGSKHSDICDSRLISHMTYDDVTIAGLSDAPDTLMQLPFEGINIVMLHGMLTPYGIYHEEGQTLSYPLSSLTNRNIDYIAAGHLHAFHQGKLDERGIYCYSGCLEGRGFDECGEKGFVLLEISEKIQTSFIAFGSRSYENPLLNVDDIKNDTELYQEAALLLDHLPQSDLVRLTLTGSTDPSFPIHPGWLKEKYSNVFYHFQLENRTVQTVSIKEDKGDISLKGEFIRQVLKADHLTEEEKTKIITEGLAALRGEEVASKI